MFLLATLVGVPMWAMNPARPGTVNYVEGQVSIGAQSLDAKSAGSTLLGADQSLVTGRGKAEVLLTPGVFVRVADNSALTMVSPDLANTEIQLNQGCAMVEVAEIHKENNLLVDENGVTTRLVKTGLYDFDANSGQVRVFDGQAMVRMDDRQVKVKGGREVSLNGPPKAQKFDKDRSKEDSFYRWASLRSDYLSEANADLARSYSNGNWWTGAGWYWDPGFGAYTFVPGDGVFYSPFGGLGYYSPWWVYSAPFNYYGGGFHSYHHPVIHPRRPGTFGFGHAQGNVGLHDGGGFRGGGRRR